MKNKDQVLLEQAYLKVLLNEKNYDEAWELFSLKSPDVKKLVKNVFKLNYPDLETMNNNPKVDELAHKLGAYMDTLPIVKYPWGKIPNLKEIDLNWIKKMQLIQNSVNPEEEYIKLMDKRDAEGGERYGGKLANKQLFNNVKQGIGDPVVLLKLGEITYAVGGRTRMFAALASKTDIKAIILTPENLSRFKIV
jgi:hypothetical protein